VLSNLQLIKLRRLSLYGEMTSVFKVLKTDIPKYTYGFKDTDDFQAVNIEKTTTGSKFNVLAHGKDLGRFEIHLFGDHSILNTTAVIAVAYTEKVPMEDIKEGLLTFKGAKRRFAEKDFGDVSVIDDYAHHPTEMRATIQAARQKFPDKELVVVFQPHTFSRTKKYQKDFEEILRDVDKAYVLQFMLLLVKLVVIFQVKTWLKIFLVQK
jgi:UDP-N-acetylmuramate--alanine ligase